MKTFTYTIQNATGTEYFNRKAHKVALVTTAADGNFAGATYFATVEAAQERIDANLAHRAKYGALSGC